MRKKILLSAIVSISCAFGATPGEETLKKAETEGQYNVSSQSGDLTPFLSTDGYTNDGARIYYPNSKWIGGTDKVKPGNDFDRRLPSIDDDGSYDFLAGYFIPKGDENNIFSNKNTITVKKLRIQDTIYPKKGGGGQRDYLGNMFAVFGAYNRDENAERTLENNKIIVDPADRKDVWGTIIAAVNQNGDVKNNEIIINTMKGDAIIAGITDKGDATGNKITIKDGTYFGITGVIEDEDENPGEFSGISATMAAGYTANGNANNNEFVITDGKFELYTDRGAITAGYSSSGGNANNNKMTISTPAFGTEYFPVTSALAGFAAEGVADNNELTFLNSNVNAAGATFAAGFGGKGASNNTLTLKNSVIEAPGAYIFAGLAESGSVSGNHVILDGTDFEGAGKVEAFKNTGFGVYTTATVVAGATRENDLADPVPVNAGNKITAKGQVAAAGLEGFDTLIIEVDPQLNGITDASYDEKGDIVGIPNTKTLSNGDIVEAKHVITIIDDGLPKKGRAMLFAAPLGGSVTAKKASIDLTDKTIIVRQAAGAGALEFSDLDNKIAYGLIGADRINFNNTKLINTSTFINEVKILNSAQANVAGSSINGALNGNFNTDIPTPALIADPNSYYNKQKVDLGIPVAPVTPPVTPPVAPPVTPPVTPPVAPVTPDTPADPSTPSSSPSASNPNSSTANTTSNALNTNRLPDGVVVSHRSITLTPEAATLTSAMLGEASVLGYAGNFAATRNIDSAFKTALQDESLNSANIAKNLNAKNAIKAKAGEQGLIWDNNTSRIVTFAAGELKHLRHSADAHTRINSWNGSVGVAHLGDVNGGDLWLKSAFVEFGGGRSRSDIGIAHGYGNHKYIGLGLATRYSWENGVFAELTARVGKSETHFEGEYSRTAQKAKYTNSRLYWGAHVGLGYAYALAPSWQLIPSAKYVFTQLKGGNVDVKFEGGGRNELEVKNINTHSLRLSTRLEHTLSENCDIYGAATYQRTWGSKASSWLHSGLGSAPLFTPSLKGNTLIGALGGGMKIAKNTRLEAGVEGYILDTKGASVNLSILHKF